MHTNMEKDFLEEFVKKADGNTDGITGTAGNGQHSTS